MRRYCCAASSRGMLRYVHAAFMSNNQKFTSSRSNASEKTVVMTHE